MTMRTAVTSGQIASAFHPGESERSTVDTWLTAALDSPRTSARRSCALPARGRRRTASPPAPSSSSTSRTSGGRSRPPGLGEPGDGGQVAAALPRRRNRGPPRHPDRPDAHRSPTTSSAASSAARSTNPRPGRSGGRPGPSPPRRASARPRSAARGAATSPGPDRSGDFLSDRTSILGYVGVHPAGCVLGFQPAPGTRDTASSRPGPTPSRPSCARRCCAGPPSGRRTMPWPSSAGPPRTSRRRPGVTLVLDVALDAPARTWLRSHPEITVHCVTGAGWLGLLHRLACAVDPGQLAELQEVQRRIRRARRAAAAEFSWSRGQDGSAPLLRRSPAAPRAGAAQPGPRPGHPGHLRCRRGRRAARRRGHSVRRVARRSGVSPGGSARPSPGWRRKRSSRSTRAGTCCPRRRRATSPRPTRRAGCSARRSPAGWRRRAASCHPSSTSTRRASSGATNSGSSPMRARSTWTCRTSWRERPPCRASAPCSSASPSSSGSSSRSSA